MTKPQTSVGCTTDRTRLHSYSWHTGPSQKWPADVSTDNGTSHGEIRAIVRQQDFARECAGTLALRRQTRRNRQRCEKTVLSNTRAKQNKQGENTFFPGPVPCQELLLNVSFVFAPKHCAFLTLAISCPVGQQLHQQKPKLVV